MLTDDSKIDDPDYAQYMGLELNDEDFADCSSLTAEDLENAGKVTTHDEDD